MTSMQDTPIRSPDGFIVNLCPTGMVLDRALNPHVPLTPEEIAADVHRCVALGANLVHLHARDENGHPHAKDLCPDDCRHT
jgi:uncharacterized protein (DUF849 family)